MKILSLDGKKHESHRVELGKIFPLVMKSSSYDFLVYMGEY